jgi:hypothetical protein
VFNNAIPTIYDIVLRAEFNPEDAQCVLVMNEMITLQKNVSRQKGEAFVQFMSEAFFPSILMNTNVDKSVTTEFLRAIMHMEAGPLKKIFKSFVIALRTVRK